MDIRNYSNFFLFWPHSRRLLWQSEYIEEEGYRLTTPTLVQGWYPFEEQVNNGVTYERAKELESGMRNGMHPKAFNKNQIAMEQALAKSRERGIKVLFVQLPLDKNMRELMDPKELNTEQILLDQFKERYGASVEDYKSEPLLREGDFTDPIHLNEKGASKFTKSFSKILIESD